MRWLGRTLARTEPMYGASAGASGLAAQAVVHGVEMVADVADVRHRPDQAEMPGQRGQARVQLADAHAGDRRGDRPVGAANFRRRRGLQVPGVEVAGSAAQQDEDARLLGGTAAKSSLAIDARRNHPRQAQSQGADPAGLEKSAARDQGGLLSLVAQRKTHRSFPGKRVVVVARLMAVLILATQWARRCSPQARIFRDFRWSPLAHYQPRTQSLCRQMASIGRGSQNEAVGTRTQDLRIKSPLLYQLSYSLAKGFTVTSCASVRKCWELADALKRVGLRREAQRSTRARNFHPRFSITSCKQFPDRRGTTNVRDWTFSSLSILSATFPGSSTCIIDGLNLTSTPPNASPNIVANCVTKLMGAGPTRIPSRNRSSVPRQNL